MSNFYCAAPWRGLHINPQGSVKTCCAGNPHMLGNLNTSTIEEILESNKLKEIRRSIAQGIPHDYCSNCVNAERFGADGERKWHNDVNPNFDYATAGENYHWPTIVDVRWNNTCNLSCVYCGPTCSSKWAALQNIPFKSGTRPYYEQVCDFINQHKEHVHEVALVGGEPLLLPENVRLLDVIPENAIVTLITNLTVNLEDNKIFKKLSQRPRVGWSMSFDNIESRFEYVRYGSEWSTLQKNLDIIKNLMKTQGHWGGIHAVYNIYNATRICEFRKFADDNGLTLVWQNLFQPDYLDPFLLGADVAKLALAEINKFYESGLATDAEKNFFDQALVKYESIVNDQPKMIKKFANHTELIELRYHPDQAGNFIKLWPELEFLCK